MLRKQARSRSFVLQAKASDAVELLSNRLKLPISPATDIAIAFRRKLWQYCLRLDAEIMAAPEHTFNTICHCDSGADARATAFSISYANAARAGSPESGFKDARFESGDQPV